MCLEFSLYITKAWIFYLNPHELSKEISLNLLQNEQKQRKALIIAYIIYYSSFKDPKKWFTSDQGNHYRVTHIVGPTFIWDVTHSSLSLFVLKNIISSCFTERDKSGLYVRGVNKS